MLLRAGWFVVLVGSISTLVGQIRTIPQQLRDSVAHPALVEQAPLVLEHPVMDLGTIDEDQGPWRGTVVARNVGREPLLIERTTTTCGCLQATWEHRPLLPGEQVTLQVTYRPLGHPGTVHQRLFLYTNCSKRLPTAVLTLRGVVRPSQQSGLRYPYVHGTLQMRRERVNFERREGVQQTRIAVRNGGRRSVTIQTDTLLSSSGVRLWSEPRSLAAGQEGDLVVEYEAGRCGDAAPRLYWQGIPLPPRERKIEVTIAETK